MSALLLKDFYMIRKYCRLQLILTVVFIAGYALGGPGNMSIFMLAYPIIMAAMIPYTLLAYEERDKWDVYARSLPLSVRDLVAEKYILGLIMITAVSVIVVILSFITGFLPANAAAGSGRHLYQTVKLLPILIAGGLLYQSLMMPAILHFGVEKGRYVYLGLLACFFAIFIALQKDVADYILLHTSGVRLWAIFPVFLIIYGLSFLLSVRLYSAKEL